MTKLSSTKIYACGGAAINITKELKAQQDVLGFSDFTISRMDSSEANLKPGMPKDTVYTLEGIHGGGKDRAYVYKKAVAAASQMLSVQPPADFNIVVFSLSGASGSTIGPVIISELLRLGLPVTAICIGTHGGLSEARNTVATLKTFSGIAQAVKAPIVASYFEVNQQSDQKDVDNQVRQRISSLLNLLDSSNVEVDQKDLINFFRFTNLHPGTNKLVMLDLFIDEDLKEIGGTSPLAMATIFKDAERPYLGVTPDYSATGTRDPNVIDERMQHDVHYVITDNRSTEIYRHMSERLAALEENKKKRGISDSLIEDTETNDDGFVF